MHCSQRIVPEAVYCLTPTGSSEWKPGDEPYYPVNDEKNNKLYQEYKKMSEKEEKVIFGGRLGEYKYYDMDVTIRSALNLAESLLK